MRPPAPLYKGLKINRLGGCLVLKKQILVALFTTLEQKITMAAFNR